MFCRCQDIETYESIGNYKIETIQSLYEEEPKADDINSRLEIDWTNHSEKKVNNQVLFEFPVQVKGIRIQKSKYYLDTIHYALLFHQVKGMNPQFLIIESNPMKETESIKSSFIEPTKFTGKLRIYSLDGEIDFEQTAVTSVGGGGNGGCSGYPPCGGAPIDFPSVGCCSADTDGRPPQFDDADTQGGWCGEIPCDDSGGGSNYTSYERCIYYGDCDEFEDQWEEDNIDYSQLPHCLTQLVQDLLNCDSSDLGNLVRQFDADGLVGDNFNLIFQTIDGLQNDSDKVVHAQATVSSDWHDFFIQFDLDNNGNRTDLALYSTIAHEVVHTILLFRLYNESPNYQYDHGHLVGLDYHEVFDLYVQEFPWPDGSDTDEEHNFMANHTVSLIANSIQEMDSNSHSREFYWNLAWGGLQETTTWQNMADQYSIYQAIGQDFEIEGFEYVLNAEQFEQINTDINGENNYGSQNTKGEKILENNGDCTN